MEYFAVGLVLGIAAGGVIVWRCTRPSSSPCWRSGAEIDDHGWGTFV